MSVPKGYRFGPRLSHKMGRKPSDGLSKRQIAVLAAIGDGLSTKEIADRMKQSTKNIEYHRGRLNDILKTSHNTVKLARIAIGFGLSSLCVLFIAGCTSTTPTTPPPPVPPTNAPPKSLTAPKAPLLATPLVKPQKFQTTTVTVAWNPSVNAAGYILLWGPSTNFSNTVITTLPQAHLTGLRVNTTYYFEVKVRNSDPATLLGWKAALWPNTTEAPLQ